MCTGNPSEVSPESALEPLDESLTRVLVENHRRFRSFLAKRVTSDEVAEDILQQCLRKALEAPAKSEDELTVVAWFYRILRNSLTDYYRSRAREDKVNEKFQQELVINGDDHTNGPDELEATICACMNALLPTLKPEYGALIKRIDLDGQAISDVASDLGITISNLNVRLHRARKALKTSLERACGTCTEHGCLNCTCE